MSKHQLIGTQVSLYTGKVRAYLRYKKIPHVELLSRAEVYRDIIIPRTGVRFIPVLISDDDQAIQDTSDIIDYLEQRYPEPAIYPYTAVQGLVALLLEVYGDEWLVNPAMHYRWNVEENRQFAIREFGRTSAPDLPPKQQQALGEKLSRPFAGALPRLGITEHSAPAIEQSYLALLADLDCHFQAHPYLLGARPSIGDYGLIGPLYAHLYRDPYSGRLMKDKAPHVARWVERMHSPDGAVGDFLADDEIPATLLPILARMFSEQVPVILNTIDQLDRWAQQNEGPEIPRAIGSHIYEIAGVKEERLIFPFNQWMWQRPYDHYQGLKGKDRERAEALLEQLPGGLMALSYTPKRRVARQDNRLILDDENGSKPEPG